MRICVIGTSNAIYKDGYCGGIADDGRVDAFQKYCIGASPSVIIPYFSSVIDFSQFDWVVFDTAINDRNYYKYDSIRKDQIRMFLEHGIASAAAAGCRSALLIMPSRKIFDRTTIARLIYTKVAAENGLPILDGFHFVDSLVASGEIDTREAAFIDDFHLMKPLARRAGLQLLDLIARQPHPIPKITVKNTFRVARLAAAPDAIRRANSILTADFLRLDNEGIVIPAAPGEELIGLSFNAGVSTGSVCIGDDCVKSLRTKYAGTGRDFLLMVTPVVSAGLRPVDGGIRLRLTGNNTHVTEHSRFERLPALSPDSVPSLELEAAILRRRI